MRIFTIQMIFVCFTFFLAIYELLGILRARRMGLTKNVSRILSHSLIVVFIIGGLIQSIYWQDRILELQSTLMRGIPLLNLPLMFTAALAAVISGLEAVEVYKARRLGLTKNISRIITHSVMFFLMAAVISLNLAVTV